MLPAYAAEDHGARRRATCPPRRQVGCNANQEVNLSSRTAPEVFAGRYVDNYQLRTEQHWARRRWPLKRRKAGPRDAAAEGAATRSAPLASSSSGRSTPFWAGVGPHDRGMEARRKGLRTNNAAIPTPRARA
jgi:IS5 family transposase